ncbi:MAG TPA: metalloregulator ArsR/SmtB family transcription factor [Armatimonadota bacterium]|nr:metalloregulator ArsR/SmtB family transcription factor [Armatimonadota bacterium]
MTQHLPLSDQALELIAHRFKLLSEPTRLRILQLLMGGEKSVTELVQAMQTTQANVSKHLGILADGGLVARRKEGVSTFYRIADPSLTTLCNLVCASLQERSEEVALILKPPAEEAGEA